MDNNINDKETYKCLKYVVEKYLKGLENLKKFEDYSEFTIDDVQYVGYNDVKEKAMFFIPKKFDGFNKPFNEIFRISKMKNKLFFTKISFEDNAVLTRQFICNSQFQTEEITCNIIKNENVEEINKKYIENNYSIVDFISYGEILFQNSTQYLDMTIVKKYGSTIKYGRTCGSNEDIMKFYVNDMEDMFIDVPNEDKSAFEIIDILDTKKAYVKTLKNN